MPLLHRCGAMGGFFSVWVGESGRLTAEYVHVGTPQARDGSVVLCGMQAGGQGSVLRGFSCLRWGFAQGFLADVEAKRVFD